MARIRIQAILPFVFLLALLTVVAIACSQDTTPRIYVTATVQLVPSGEPTLRNPFKPTPTPFGPTATPIQPTPNPTYPPRNQNVNYTVQAGDTLAVIAQLFGTTVEGIVALNAGLDMNAVINVGQVLTLPGRPSQTTPNFKIIPDSELVYSEKPSQFDVGAYIRFQPGFIRVHSENVAGRFMSATDIVEFVSKSTSVSPRLLMALLEYRGGWISNPVPDATRMDFPMGLMNQECTNLKGLFNQLNCAANLLNAAYYGFKQRGLIAIQFMDRSRMAYAPELNPGSVAMQYFLSRSVDRATWEQQISPQGFFTTYMSMFGDPFGNALEPLVPADLKSPEFRLPFQQGETWYLTSGPHGGWDNNTGWAAIDFAPPKPPDELVAAQGFTYVSPAFVTAIASGLIVRSNDGVVVLDLDMDGNEHTGWTIVYLHVAAQDRIQAGTAVQAGQPIGHPSCEGFYLNCVATHIHISRRYNGEWIPADCWACAPGVAAPPFVMSGWVIKGYANRVYQGWLEKDGQVRRAQTGRDEPENQISW
jgi:LysM repeat protein